MLEGSHGVTCCMSYPVIRKSHFGKLIHCATSSLEASSPLPLPVSVLLWSPPTEIVTFHHSCVSNVHTRGPPGGAAVMYPSPDKIECRPPFKMWTGCWCVRLFSLFRVIRSEGTCLWMFRFHWRVDVPAGEDYLQAPCFCCSVERAVWHYLAHCDRLPCLSVLWRNVRYSYSAFLNYIRMCSNSCSLDRQENQIGICAGLFFFFF